MAFLAGTGYRRGNLLGSDPAASRYAYLTVALLLPLIALAAPELFRGGAWRRVVLVLLTLVLVVAQVRKLDHQTVLARPGKDSDRGAVLATAALARDGRQFLLSRPLSAFEPQVTVGEIVQMYHDGKLPPLDEATVTDRLTVLARLDLFVGRDPVVPVRRGARRSSQHDTSTSLRTRTVASPCARDPTTSSCCASPVPERSASAATVCSACACAIRRAARKARSCTPCYLRQEEQVVSTATPPKFRLVASLPTDHPTVVCDVVQ